MRAGYKVLDRFEKECEFILVANLHNLNEVVNYGCEDLKELNYHKDDYDIGFWRIKRKETIKTK